MQNDSIPSEVEPKGSAIRKVGIAATAGTLASVGLLGSVAGATPSATETAVTGAATTLKDEMISIGTAVLPLGAAVLALTMGWRFARKFVRG